MTRAALPRKPKTTLCYGDSDRDEHPYEVELGDQVEFRHMMTGPLTHCGEITAVYPRKREVRVRYQDEDDWTRKTAEPKVKVATVPVSCVELIRRVM